jgi:alkanesulfonate monooxygenase SsuD/methylene tetrahydromethanopterin reductase-like flavin-dependent oxidoreductase (luciferase family)
MFGLDLLDVKGRMRRFEEGLQVVSKLLKSGEPFSFSGDFYDLKDAILLPRPARPGGPPIVVGGNGRHRTLQLAAMYADEWNGTSQTPERFRDRMQRLDKYLAKEGRKSTDLRRTAMAGLAFGRDKGELEKRIAFYGRNTEEIRAEGKLVGDAHEIAEQLNALAEAGCQRVMLQWLDQDDLEGLESLAKVLLPQFKE